MFGRDKKTAQPQDQAFPFMTATEGQEFRTLVAAAFSAAGNPVLVLRDEQYAMDTDGQQYGLWNLAAFCHSHEQGRAGWEQAIAQHVHTLVNPPPAVSSLTDAELLELVHTRLYSADDLGDTLDWVARSASALLDGVVECLVADFPTTVSTLNTDDLAARDAQALWARGRANTRAVPIDEIERVENPNGGTITVAYGDSFFLASRVVDMPALLAEVFGPREFPLGVVVGVPHRHAVIFHALDNVSSIMSIGVTAKFTAHSYGNNPGGISPLLYWWNGQSFQTVSRLEPDGGVGIVVDGPFLDVVNALAER